MLRACKKRWCWSQERGFMNKLARLAAEGICSKTMVPNCTSSRIEWCHILICLTFVWSLVFFVNATAPLLSPLISPGPTRSIATSSSHNCIHTICWVHWDIATYSASTINRATVGCHLLDHVTGLPAIRKTYPDVERRMS